MGTQDNRPGNIELYFDNIEARLALLDTTVAHGLVEEAFILTCCYLGGLARERFASSDNRDDMRLFTQLLRQYGSHPEVFEKISRVEITHRSIKTPFAPKALQQHNTVATAILARFGNETGVKNDPTEAELLQILSGIPRLDAENLRANLWRYTYGAVLYRRWRNTGTHVEVHTGAETSQEVYPSQANGPSVYYDLHERLAFSPTFLMNTLKFTFRTLRTECMEHMAPT
jgi:hypothetical protein